MHIYLFSQNRFKLLERRCVLLKARADVRCFVYCGDSGLFLSLTPYAAPKWQGGVFYCHPSPVLLMKNPCIQDCQDHLYSTGT